MRYIIALLVVALSGCADSQDHKKVDYGEALKTHKCTPEQFKAVEEETHFCIEETSYFSSYCFATAIMRNCAQIAIEETHALRAANAELRDAVPAMPARREAATSTVVLEGKGD